MWPQSIARSAQRQAGISFRRIVSAIRLAARFHFDASWPTWAPAVRVSQFDYMGGLVANTLLFAEEPYSFRL
jgi:hypothetical protein